MPRFGFVGPSYTSQSLNADAQETINWYIEHVESGNGNAPMVLYPSPGEQVFVDLNIPAPVSPVRQSFSGQRGSSPLTVNPGQALALNSQIFIFLKTNTPDLSVLGCIADGLGNLYSRAFSVGGVVSQFDGYLAKVVNPGVAVYTVTPTPGPETDINMIGIEVPMPNAGISYDVGLGNLANVGTTFSTATINTTHAVDILVAMAGIEGAVSPAVTDDFTLVVSNLGLSMAIKNVTSTGAYTSNWSKPGAGFASTVLVGHRYD
jgi:hypothetical protein